MPDWDDADPEAEIIMPDVVRGKHPLAKRFNGRTRGARAEQQQIISCAR